MCKAVQAKLKSLRKVLVNRWPSVHAILTDTSLKAGCPVGTQRGLPPQCALCARFLSLPGGDAELHLGGILVLAAGACWVNNSTADGSVIG